MAGKKRNVYMKITSFNKYIFPVFMFVVFGYSIRVHAQAITTIANVDNRWGFDGDGNSAAFAKFDGPRGIAVDAQGNIYIADASNNRIRKIDLFQNVTTIAGTGKAGYGGDGGLATKAELNFPTFILLDDSGNLYISDTYNYRVRKINTSGVITTIAGNGKQGIRAIGDSGLATVAEFDLPPYGLAFDNDSNLYICTAIRVRKVNKAGIISTVAGVGQTGYGGDGGPAVKAAFGQIMSAAFDKYGNMFLADMKYHTIRKVDPAGTITRYAGTVNIIPTSPNTGDGGPAINAKIVAATDMKFDKRGNLYFTDQSDGRIRMIDSEGIISTFAGNGKSVHSGDGGPAIQAGIHSPYAMTIDNDGNFFFTETSEHNTEVSNDVRYIFAGVDPNALPIELYPNPTFNGVFKIRFASAYEENVTVQIVNAQGVTVYKNSIPTNRGVNIRIDPIGIYFITAKSLHGKWRDKVSVVHE